MGADSMVKLIVTNNSVFWVIKDISVYVQKISMLAAFVKNVVKNSFWFHRNATNKRKMNMEPVIGKILL